MGATRETLEMAEDGFINLVSMFRLSGSEAHPAPAVISPPRAQASSGLLARHGGVEAIEVKIASMTTL